MNTSDNKIDIVFIGFFVLIIFSIFFLGLHRIVGHGEHTGYITAAETSGVVFKTNTVYLKTDTQSSQEDAYCVVNQEIFNQLQQAVEKKERVTVTYFEWLASGVANCNGESAVINGVK